MKIDYTKKRLSKTVRECPKCGRRGQYQHRFLWDDYYHVVNETWAREIVDHCSIPNEKTRAYLDRIVELLAPAEVDRKVLTSGFNSFQRTIERNYHEGASAESTAMEIGRRLLEGRIKKAERARHEAEALQRVVNELTAPIGVS